MDDEGKIRALLSSYEQSLNDSDAELAASCYTSDGVFMATTLPTAAGPDVREAYVQTFAQIHLKMTFTIDELVVASDAVAYALTRSNGVQTTLATGAESAESNREVLSSAAKTGHGRSPATYSTNPTSHQNLARPRGTYVVRSKRDCGLGPGVSCDEAR